MVLFFAAASGTFAAQAQDPQPQDPQPQAQSPAQNPARTPAKNGSAPSYFKQQRQAEKATEADEQDRYRHSPSVQWFARLFHVDVETAATAFEYINFLVILLLIGIPLGRWLPKAMRERRAKLSFELDEAKAKTMDANERLKNVEAKLAGLDTEIAEIRKQVEEEMVNDEARSKSLLEEETARIVAGAQQEIAAAAAQAQRGLKQFAANVAIDRALSRLTIDEETDRALFAEFAHDVAGTYGRGKGGHNA